MASKGGPGAGGKPTRPTGQRRGTSGSVVGGRRPVPASIRHGDAVSQRAFGRLVGVDDKAVRKGIASGRIPASAVGRNARGQPVISDVAAARAGWYANVARPAKGRAGSGDGEDGPALVAVQREVAQERARRLKFDNDLRAGTYVPVREAKREAFDSARVIREALLNLPARISAELAAETDPGKVFALLDAEIRTALAGLADELERQAS